MLAHLTTPEMDALTPWGDQTKSSGGALQDASRLPFLIAAAQGVPWARTWLDNAVPNRMVQRVNAAWEFLFYPEETAGTDYRQSWPGFAEALGAGILSSRTSWLPSAVQVVISAGATRESHQDRASGAFGIHAGGDWLAGWAKTSSHSGIEQETDGSNCVTIAGARQTWTQAGVTQGRIEDAAAYTALRADLTAAYASQCSGYRREYLFLKTGTLFVKDTLEGVPASAAVVSSTHSGRLLPFVTPLGYSVRGSSAQLFAVGLLPSNPAFRIINLTNDRDPGVIGYRLDLDDQGARQFLNAYEVAPLSQTESSWREWDAAQVAGAISLGWLVGWVKGAAPWSYVAPRADRHLIAGLDPGTTYTTPGGNQVASPGGILMYDGPQAGTRVTIQAADGGGGDLTRRTWAVVSANLTGVVIVGDQLTASGGQLVVTAIPGGEPLPPPEKAG
jgi:hypothetical protein